ncbi:MAG: cytochrome P450 [Rhodobacteraceae bacterium]|nr:cytochrome P450 [Paracoccaceae bacterium]
MNLIAGHRALEAPVGVPVWDIDPYDPDVLVDPMPYYRQLRERGEVVFLRRYGVLAVGRYDTTKAVFTDYENFVSSRGVGLEDFAVTEPWRPPSIILETDPPDHTKARRVMARALSPKVAKECARLFEEEADALVDALLEKGTFEAVTEFAEIYPTTVFPKAVGMTEVHQRYLVDYGAMVFNAIGPDNALRRAAMAHAPEIVPWIMASCARDRLTKDGLGAMIYDTADTGEITLDEAGMLVRSFLSAGVDTTVTGIGNALWCLSQNPEQWELLKSDPSLIRPAFEEVLRFTSPVHTFCRTAGRPTQISGVPVEEGTKVVCVLGAANHDPDKWGDPENFRVDRRPVGHVAFGVGIHGCVGQNIARAELQAVLSAMVRKVDRIEAIGEPVWRPNNAIRALDKLPIRLTPQ